MPAAPLVPKTINNPVAYGLNTELADSVTTPDWGFELDNVVYDKTGRLAARKGWSPAHATAIVSGADVRSLHPYGTSTIKDLISHAGAQFFLGTSALTDITGSTAPADGDNWKFINFHNKCMAFCDGYTPQVYSGGTLTDLVATQAGGMPTSWSGVVLSAYGRIWTTDNTKTILKYSALLDETDFDASVTATDATAGYIDLTSVWKGGIDEITAIEDFNGQLLLFCRNSIVIYSNPYAPASSMTLVENLHGIGCIARDSVQAVGKDLWFLSNSGLRSLGRTLVQDKMPVGDISKNVHTLMTAITSGISLGQDIRSVYSEREGFYLITFPAVSLSFCFDLKGQLQDGSYRCTTWTSNVPTAMAVDINGKLYLGEAGYIGVYTGYLDNATTYDITVSSCWFTMGQDSQGNPTPRYTILKKIKAYIYAGADVSFNINWRFDFSTTNKTYTKAVTVTYAGAEYNVAEYNVDEYGGDPQWVTVNASVGGTGIFFRYGFTATINDHELAMQKIDLFAKLGRLN